MHKNLLAKSVRLAMISGAAAAALSSPVAFAAEEGAKVERIEVTGSRIKRTDIETSTPVHITTAEDIKLAGFTNVEDIMNNLPQIETSENSLSSNGASGTATLDLRGLGANRTLVLVNGRRLPSGGVYSQSPDVNQIPAALIKRVEVLTGGGSSTYGADAVAGVVNFVMNDEFEGFQVNVGASGYQHDNDNSYIQGLMDDRNFEYPTGSSGIDGKTFNIDVTMGSSFADGKGHATVYATWKKTDELLQGSRDYSSCALNGAGTSCGGSANAVVPNFFFYPVVDGAVDYTNELFWGLNENNGFTPDDGTNRYNYAPVNHFQRPDERYTMGAFVDYEVNENFHPYLEVSYMNDNTNAQIAESGTFFNEEYLLDFNNPLLSDGQKTQLQDAFGIGADDQFVAYIGKRNVEGGPRASLLEHNSFRIVVGADGYINDNWSYDVSYVHGQTSSRAGYVNDFFGPRIGTAIGAIGSDECTDECIPYEVFTYNGVTEEAAGQLTGTAMLSGVTTQVVYNAFVTGEFDFALPSSENPIAAVLGFERREVEFDRLSDEVFEEGLLLGQGGPTPSLNGGYDVNEIFGELSIPLVEDVFLVDSLILELGGRYSDYSTSGKEPTYKVGIDWGVLENWKVRGSYNRAIRAPNVAELFSAQSVGLWSGNDACTGTTPSASAEACARSGVTAAQYGNISASPAGQYNQFGGGNPEVKPETADTYTVGLVGQPFDSLGFALDYWDIEVTDVIGTPGAQLSLDACINDNLFCDSVNRSAAGSLWIGETGFVNNLTSNLGGRHWQGVDLSANHVTDLFGGTLSTKLIGSYNIKKEVEPVSGLDELTYDCSGNISVDCFAQPKWRHNLSISYGMDTWWMATAKWRYYGEVDYTSTNPVDTLVADGIDAQNYFDLIGTFYITDNLSLQAGVNNLLDKEPPMVGNTLASNGNQVSGFYDTLGRYLHASATLKF
ncbi:TonB-dependent receptor [Shewanella electrodiphila]|uniref:TonB-dependent receptor n=1 Tax=Shewanella electrodiphila TaxID=934143 RepID=A0ABT0KQP4_9GAMM|nr:TonB-dependent receptor [Shewanella electrodiphila]MCL1046172.1 TonB-dependent receptor [Shewanella electrodiphila]